MSVIYEIFLQDPCKTITYIALAASIISLWFNRKVIIFGSLLLIAIIFGLISHSLNWQSCLFILFFAYINYMTFCARSRAVKIICGLTVFICSILITPLHLIYGFNNWLIAHQIIISKLSMPYTLFLNFDKPLIGLFILAFSHNYLSLLNNRAAFITIIKQAIPKILLGILLISFISYIVGYIRFDIKLNYFFIIWAISNLLFTCIPEEALFRGLVQNAIANACKPYKYNKYIANIITAALFGVILHFKGGILFIIISILAGLLYGYIYQITNKIEASIFAHFLLNICHFILFTYPAYVNYINTI